MVLRSLWEMKDASHDIGTGQNSFQILDDFPASDVASASGVTATGSVARRLEKGPTGDAGSHFDADWGEVCESTGVVFQFDVFDHRWW